MPPLQYTMSKQFPPLNSLWLCQILTDFQNFHTAKSVWNLLQNSCNITHLTLGMLLHYLGKLEIQIFCRYGRKCKQIVFVHRLLCSCNCVCWVYLCVNRIFDILSIRKHSYFLFIARSAAGWPPVKPVSRNFVNSLLRLTPRFVQLFSGNSSVNLFAVYPFKYKLFIKMSSSLIPCWLFEFLISQGSIATCLRWGDVVWVL